MHVCNLTAGIQCIDFKYKLFYLNVLCSPVIGKPFSFGVMCFKDICNQESISILDQHLFNISIDAFCTLLL